MRRRNWKGRQFVGKEDSGCLSFHPSTGSFSSLTRTIHFLLASGSVDSGYGGGAMAVVVTTRLETLEKRLRDEAFRSQCPW